MEEETEQKPLMQVVKEQNEKIALLTGEQPNKEKKYRIPRKGKVSKRKAKKGYAIVLKVDENHVGEFTKQQINGGTFDLDKRDTFHSTDGREFIYIKGVPLIIQRKDKLNPSNIFVEDNKTNETYGQKMVMARMTGDAIKLKRNASSMLWIIGIVVLGAVVGKLLHWF